MKINERLIIGRLIRRLNRFVLQVEVNGNMENSHLRDPGRLKELMIPGNKVLLKVREKTTAKTKFEVIAIRSNNIWVFVNSGFHSKIARELILSGRIKDFKGCHILKSEVIYGNSRIDFLLKHKDGQLCYLEVKGCTLVENGYGMFPDAPTERGEKHIRELIKAKREGYDAVILFVVMRPDANLVIPNMRTDIKFAKAVRDARSVGVKFFAYSFFFDGRELHPFREIKVVI
ncbi:MAG: DNA/RNA nuclease SfsA [Candidatus Odinarchaeota archaeon]|nr:DNA/RNA nuclease SfsA [Candidatus Odinarchaeota archaeon]